MPRNPNAKKPFHKNSAAAPRYYAQTLGYSKREDIAVKLMAALLGSNKPNITTDPDMLTDLALLFTDELIKKLGEE